MALELILPAAYPYILMGLSAHFFFLNMIPPLFLLKVKGRVYSKENLEKYQEEHTKAFGDGTKVDPLGLPDQGTGWYSKDLGYKDWIDI